MIREPKELYGLVVTSAIRQGILRTLEKSKQPQLQSAIAKTMKRKQQDISKEIYTLEKYGLVECSTPDKGSYKAYIITEQGRRTLDFKL